MKKALLLCFFLTACLPWNSKQAVTKTYANTTGIGIEHDASVQAPPEVQQDKKEEALPVPAGSTVTVEETGPTETTPATVKTTITLPANKGMNITKLDVKTKMNGSKGFEPEKGPTPTEKANAGWTWGGIAMAAAGIFLCTPWGGTNYRVGAVVFLGGIGMSLIGKFISEIKIPSGSAFLAFLVFALAMYYGYRIRHKQIQSEQPTPT